MTPNFMNYRLFNELKCQMVIEAGIELAGLGFVINVKIYSRISLTESICCHRKIGLLTFDDGRVYFANPA